MRVKIIENHHITVKLFLPSIVYRNIKYYFN